MEKELHKPQYEEAGPPHKATKHPERTSPTPAPSLDICEISTITFYLNLCRKEIELFSVSLYEIDQELESHQLIDDSDNLEEVHQKLPK